MVNSSEKCTRHVPPRTQTYHSAFKFVLHLCALTWRFASHVINMTYSLRKCRLYEQKTPIFDRFCTNRNQHTFRTFNYKIKKKSSSVINVVRQVDARVQRVRICILLKYFIFFPSHHFQSYLRVRFPLSPLSFMNSSWDG